MKKILVPTDFSECSYHAAEVAASIAKKTGARIYLLHALEIPHYSSNDSLRESIDTAEGIFLLKYTKMEFQKILKSPFFEGVNVVEVLQYENAYDTICQQATEHEIDLIVMGSHGASGSKEFLIGSNTEKVIRLADCPVLTIKNRHENFDVKNIAFASNFYGESKRVFNKIEAFAKIFNSKLHLLKVVTPHRFESTSYSMKLMEDFKANVGIKDCTLNVYNEHVVEQGVNGFAESIGADMVAIETHGRTGIAHLLKGSLAEDIANHSTRPVLTIKIKDIPVEYGGLFPS